MNKLKEEKKTATSPPKKQQARNKDNQFVKLLYKKPICQYTDNLGNICEFNTIKLKNYCKSTTNIKTNALMNKIRKTLEEKNHPIPEKKTLKQIAIKLKQQKYSEKHALATNNWSLPDSSTEEENQAEQPLRASTPNPNDDNNTSNSSNDFINNIDLSEWKNTRVLAKLNKYNYYAPGIIKEYGATPGTGTATAGKMALPSNSLSVEFYASEYGIQIFSDVLTIGRFNVISDSKPKMADIGLETRVCIRTSVEGGSEEVFLEGFVTDINPKTKEYTVKLINVDQAQIEVRTAKLVDLCLLLPLWWDKLREVTSTTTAAARSKTFTTLSSPERMKLGSEALSKVSKAVATTTAPHQHASGVPCPSSSPSQQDLSDRNGSIKKSHQQQQQHTYEDFEAELDIGGDDIQMDDDPDTEEQRRARTRSVVIDQTLTSRPQATTLHRKKFNDKQEQSTPAAQKLSDSGPQRQKQKEKEQNPNDVTVVTGGRSASPKKRFILPSK